MKICARIVRMKERRERPKWLKVVDGGRKDDDGSAKPRAIEGDAFDFNKLEKQVEEKDRSESDIPTGFLGADDPSFTFKSEGANWRQIGESAPPSAQEIHRESDLVRLYLNLHDNSPANFRRNVREERVAEYQPALRAWTVDALHKYLSSGRVWTNPSFTEAVFREINGRMKDGNMQPRE